jgi:hypothetical protein
VHELTTMASASSERTRAQLEGPVDGRVMFAVANRDHKIDGYSQALIKSSSASHTSVNMPMAIFFSSIQAPTKIRVAYEGYPSIAHDANPSPLARPACPSIYPIPHYPPNSPCPFQSRS